MARQTGERPHSRRVRRTGRGPGCGGSRHSPRHRHRGRHDGPPSRWGPGGAPRNPQAHQDRPPQGAARHHRDVRKASGRAGRPHRRGIRHWHRPPDGRGRRRRPAQEHPHRRGERRDLRRHRPPVREDDRGDGPRGGGFRRGIRDVPAPDAGETGPRVRQEEVGRPGEVPEGTRQERPRRPIRTCRDRDRPRG